MNISYKMGNVYFRTVLKVKMVNVKFVKKDIVIIMENVLVLALPLESILTLIEQ